MAKIIHKKSAVVGKIPATVDLDYGELALNYADGKLFYKASNNTIQSFGGAALSNVVRQQFTATAGQTNFTLSYTPGQLDVYLNGVKLVIGTDYTASSGTGFTLAAAAAAGDIVDVVAGIIFASSDWQYITNKPTTLNGFGITDAQPLSTNLTSISALTGTSGFLKTNGAGTYSVDTSTYITGNQNIVFSGDATGNGTTSVSLTLANSGVTAGTYTKVMVDAKGRVTNGYSLTSADLPTYTGTITSSQVTTALGFTPYNATNPSGYISGNQTITFSGDATGSGATSVSLTLANSGVTAGTYGSSTAVPVVVVDAKGRVTSISTQSISGSLTFTGDVTGTGTTGSSTALTLANSGVTAGTYTKVTVDAKGRATSGTTLSASDIPNLDASKITSGTIDAARLPSYVDDVLEYTNLASFPVSGETAKIYVALDSNKTYRWSGSAYIEISASPGTTDSLVEGSTNLYFTNARARSAISVTQNLTYNSTTGVITGPNLSSYLTGNQTITFSGDATGSGATSVALTLANSGVTAGTYTKVTVDAKGRVTTGATLASADLPTYTGTITSSQVTTALGFTPLSNAGGTLSGNLNIGSAPSSNASAFNLVGYNAVGGTGYHGFLTVTNTFGTATTPNKFFRLNSAGGIEIVNSAYSALIFSLSDSGVLANVTMDAGVINTGTINTARLGSGTANNTTYLRGDGTWATIATSSGTVTSVSGTGTVSGLTLTGTVTGSGSLTLGGTLTLTSGQVTTALGFTPYNSTNPSGYVASGAATNFVANSVRIGSWTGSAAYRGLFHNSMSGNEYAIISGDSDVNTYLSAFTGGHVVLRGGNNVQTFELRVPGSSRPNVAGNTILDAGNFGSYALPLSGGTLTGALTWAAASGLGNGNARSLVTGYSGGNYGQIGYGIAYTATSNVHNYAINDIVSMWEAFDGIRVFAAAGGTVGTAISWTTVLDARRSNSAMVFKGQTVLDAGNYTSYSPSLTGSGASGTWGINITGNAATATSADNIDGRGFRNTGANDNVNADSLDSNGITYYTAGVTNFSGNATDGALYSQAYSSSWQHQIAGDYRSGQIALRGKNSGTWQAWRTVLDSGNYSGYALPLSGGTVTGAVTINGGSSQPLSISTSSGSPWGFGLVRTDTGANSRVFLHNPGSGSAWIFEHLPYFYNGGAYNVPLHNGNYSSYALPLSGGGLTGATTLTAGHGDTRFQLKFNYSGDVNSIYSGSLLLWVSEPGISYPYSGIGANINNGGQYYGRQATGQPYGVYIRFNTDAGQIQFWNTSGTPGTAGGQGTQRGYLAADGEMYLTSSSNKVLHAGNYTSYSPSLTGSGASGTWSINITGNAATATTLQTARNINGTSFNGSANITTASWGTARTLTIGNTGKSVDGSGNVTWTLAEIGAGGGDGGPAYSAY